MTGTSAQYELSLSDYWRIFRKRFKIIASITLVVLAAAAFYLNRQTPQYRATAVVKIEQNDGVAGGLFNSYRGYYENPMVTEARVIESRSIAEMVARRMLPEGQEAAGAAFERRVRQLSEEIAAEPVEETNLIRITAAGTDPERAMIIANHVAEAYLEFNLKEKNRQAEKVRRFVESQVLRTEVRLKLIEEAIKRLRESGDVSGRAAVLQNRITDLRSQLANLTPKLTDVHPDVIRAKVQLVQLEAQLAQLPQSELDMSRLKRELEVTERSYRTLRERLEEARIAEAEKIANASIIERAGKPGNPVHLRKRVGLMVGGVLGLILGCVAAFIFETMDTSIGTIEEIEALLQVPVLAVIPHYDSAGGVHERRIDWIKSRLKRGQTEREVGLFAHREPHAPITEACRILKTNLRLSEERRSILITSAGPGEGKTTILSNLGIIAAQGGVKTLMVSADLRRPSLDKIYGLQKGPGLSEVLRGDLEIDKAVRGLADFVLGKLGYDEAMKNPYLANLSVLTSGSLPDNAAEILGSEAMRRVIDEAREKFGVVLIDAPPLLPVADSLLLAPHVDGVVLVYQVGRISRAALTRAKVQLEGSGARLLGVVLNHVQPEVESLPQDYYYYRRKYGQEGAEEEGTKQGAVS